MAAAYLGYLPRPTAASAEDEIRRARDLTHGGPTPASTATWGWQDVAAFRSLGAQAYALAPTLAAIDNVLAHGGVVLAMGDPRQAWGLVLDGRGHYLHHYDPSPADRFGHTVVVFLKAADGTYVIGDPLSTSGVFRASAASLAQYFGDYGTLAEAVEVHPRGG